MDTLTKQRTSSGLFFTDEIAGHIYVDINQNVIKNISSIERHINVAILGCITTGDTYTRICLKTLAVKHIHKYFFKNRLKTVHQYLQLAENGEHHRTNKFANVHPLFMILNDITQN